jgi:hypothetical protein
MKDSLKEMAMKDHMTNDTQYNRGLERLRLIGSDYWFWNDDVRYYLYCNGIGHWN